jgi:hypothetical protein
VTSHLKNPFPALGVEIIMREFAGTARNEDLDGTGDAGDRGPDRSVNPVFNEKNCAGHKIDCKCLSKFGIGVYCKPVDLYPTLHIAVCMGACGSRKRFKTMC